MIVHADNPITNLSIEQLRLIYGGRVTDWQALTIEQDLGEIQLIGREEESGARILFDERVMRGERLSLTALIAPTNAAAFELVRGNRFAIGYVDQAYIQNVDTQVRVVAVDGLLPEPDTIADQTYPLIYPLYLVHRTNPTADVDMFVKWLTSDSGQAIIRQFHVLPQAN